MTPLHRDLSALGDRLAAWSPPQGAFDPLAAWALSYARHGLVPTPGGAPGGAPTGSLRVALTPAGDRLTLQVSEAVQAGFTTLTTDAEIACAQDALLTPRSWSLNLRWQTGLPSGAAHGELDQTRSGRADGKTLVFKAAKERRRDAPKRWTSFWSLFAAVQRLPFAVSSSLSFDLFDELELHKPGQRLAYIGPQPVALGGGTLHLHVFEQTGRGVLPWRWWLDGQHRVLLAAGGRRAYLLESAKSGGAA